MFLFIILLLIAAILTIVSVIALSIFGASMLIIFGDVIVCIFIIGWIIKKIFFK